MGEWMYRSTHYWPWHSLAGGEWSASGPGRFTPPPGGVNSPQYPLNRVGPRAGTDMEKILDPTRTWTLSQKLHHLILYLPLHLVKYNNYVTRCSFLLQCKHCSKIVNEGNSRPPPESGSNVTVGPYCCYLGVLEYSEVRISQSVDRWTEECALSPGRGKIFSSTQHPQWLWDSPSLLPNGHSAWFPQG
jgi:hypothetical protein